MFRDKNRGFSDFSLTLSTLYHFEVCQKLFILLSDFILNLSTLCHFRKFLNSSSCYYYKSNCQQNFLHNYWNVLICCTDLACLWINYNKARTWYLVKVHIKWFDQRRTQDMQGTWSFGRKTLILPYFCLIQDSGRMCCKKKTTQETWTALFTRQKHKCLSYGINMELEFWVSTPFPYQMSACLEGVWSNCMGV